MMCRSVSAIVVSFLAAFAVHTSDAQTVTFEVVSIKRNVSLAGDSNFNVTPAGGLTGRNVTAKTLILFAYRISNYQLSGAPSWIDTERYDLDAKPPEGATAIESFGSQDSPGNQELRMRTQALLAERFHLVVHRESKEVTGFALVVDKSGAKMQSWKEEDGPGPNMRGEDRKLTCRKYTMQRFAQAILANHYGVPVIDKTGLSGEYSFVMNFEPDPPLSASASASTETPAGPTFTDALRDQLGLKLEKQKVPSETLVIDHLEKASEN